MAIGRALIEAIAAIEQLPVEKKKTILGEFIKVTGFRRKHPIRALKRTTGNRGRHRDSRLHGLRNEHRPATDQPLR